MIQDNFKITCSEVYIFLQLLGKDYIEKLPSKLYEFFEKEKDLNYTLNISIDKSLKEQFKSEETLLYISYLNLMYWTTEEQRNMLIKVYKENDEKYFESLHELNENNNNNNNLINTTYSADIFYNKSDKTTNVCQELVVEKNKQNFLQKLNNFVRKLFSKNK